MPDDPWAAAAKSYKPQTGGTAPTSGEGEDWKVWQQAAATPDPATANNSSYSDLGADWQGVKNAVSQTPLPLLRGIIHPIDTVKAVGTGIANMGRNAVSEGKEAIDAAKQGSYGAAVSHGIQAVPVIGQAMKYAGEDMNVSPLDKNGERPNTYGSNLKNLISSPKSMGTLVGASAMAAVPTAKGIVRAGGGDLLSSAGDTVSAPLKAARTAAIGDTDAAALKGLRVPAAGKKVLPMQDSVETARPYLKGASSLEDLQGRVKSAKPEIYKPVQDVLDAVGDNPMRGPDGMTTLNELEAERLQLSAMNRGLKTGDPAALQLAQQKGLSQADALAREKLVKAHIDPEMQRYGVDSSGIRGAYGSVARVGNQVAGRSTLLEKPQAYGFGKIANPFELAKGVEITKPSTYIKPLSNLASAGRDVVAGRYWNESPTDVNIREGFADAGEKPNFGNYKPIKPIGLLNKPPIEMPAPAEHGGVPEGYRPPDMSQYYSPEAMRRGHLLEAPPIELGGEVEGPRGTPFRYDTTPMRKGRILPSSISDDIPLSSHSDIFPDQISSGTRLRPLIEPSTPKPEIIIPKKKR